MAVAYQLRPVTFAREKPIRDPKYLAWLRSQPCLVCRGFGPYGRNESAHTGPGGMSAKACDRKAVPLCESDHRTGEYAYHGRGMKSMPERKWCKFHRIDLEKEIKRLRRLYLRSRKE